MLTEKDLVRIGEVMDKRLDPLMEHQIMPQFEYMHQQFHYMHEQFGIIKNTMVTKSFLDERLDRFQIDHKLSYRSKK